MPKRGENIYKRKDGRWEGRIRVQDTRNKKKHYKSVYGKTYKEVKEKMDAVRKMPQTKKVVSHLTMAEAAHTWVNARKSNWKSGTYAIYCQMIHKYVIPCLGNIPVEEINNRIMEGFLFSLMNQKSGKELSKNYLFQICGLVIRILEYMNRQYCYDIVIPANPVAKKTMNQVFLPGESSLSRLEDYLYQNCEKDTCLGILIAFHTGIRLGELSGLKWQDIDMHERVIYIRRNILRVKENGGDYYDEKNKTQIIEQIPKTCESKRIIPIPPRLYPLLCASQKKDTEYVISGKRKAWAEPRTIQYRFKKILRECDIEYFNFHMLRHAFATRCVGMGLDIKSLSGILGHSNIQMTLNLYVHPTIQQKRQLMEKYNFSYIL